MKNTWVIAGIAVIIIIAGIFLFKSRTSAPVIEDQKNQEVVGDTTSAPTTATTTGTTVSPTPATTTGTTSGTTPTTTTKSFTLAQIATHNNSQTSCYSAINGVVYDLTSWVTRHPGGAREILGICGKDGTSAFNGQHGTQGRPASILSGFEIGTLVK